MENKQIDILIERPNVVEIGRTPIYFYPVSLGKSFLIERLTKQLEIDSQRLSTQPQLEMLRVVEHHRDIVVRMLSYHASYGKKQIFDVRYQKKLYKKLNTLSEADLATLLIAISGMQEPLSKIMKALGIDNKQKTMAKIRKAKDDSSSITVGGASIYGQLIDAAAERYGWSYDYIMWGVSMTNLQLMLADKVDSIYLTKEEQKKARISTDNEVIDAGDPRNRELVRKWFAENGEG